MSKYTIIFFCLIFSLTITASDKVESVLKEIDVAIKNSSVYTNKHEKQIENLKTSRKATPQVSLRRYNINKELYKAYKAFVCDSAIVYLNDNIQTATALHNDSLAYESSIQLAHLLASTAMYKEAADLMASIPISKLSGKLLLDYYVALDHIYSELSLYTLDKISASKYRHMSESYKDSLYKKLPHDSEQFLIMDFINKLYNASVSEARNISEKLLSNEKIGQGKYALMAYYQALTYRREGDRENEKYYFALSALSDIYSATKDHASLWMLAQILFEEGDNIERAYNYISYSWSATAFYNSQLRNRQSSGILSLIDKAYQATIKQQNTKLQLYLIAISLLLLLLIFALFYIYKQMKRLSIARENLQRVNSQLKVLNKDLSESNQIKDEYIGRFINLSSSYIDKFDMFRKMVNKNLSIGKVDELIKITRSTQILDDNLHELYSNFDNAFLQIFPDFVQKFNALLQSEYHIMPKKNELLTTELRIFALIRIGIEDSSQIAEFLRYSVNTIYNYRAKVKNYAIGSRDNFENDVKKIR
ncbi:DUF6377 domain-containing protein [Paludibacter sp.]